MKKTTFYLEEELEKKLSHWMHTFLEVTGHKITKTAVITMLLKALLDNDSAQQDIKEME